MTRTFSIIPLAALAILMTLFTGNLEASPSSDLAKLVKNVEKTSNDLKTEFQSHYKASSAYRHLINDVNELLAKAGNIDKLSKTAEPSARRIQADLKDLGNVTRHLEDLTKDIQLGRYSGDIERSPSTVEKKLKSLKSSIADMEKVVAKLTPSASKSKEGGWSKVFSGLLK